MKIFDIDELFEKYVRELMVKDAGKFTEEEWEDRIPTLYEEFGNKPLSCFGGKSTVDYYASLSGKELCSLLKAHVEEEVSVSDYLCEAIVSEDRMIPTTLSMKAFKYDALLKVDQEKYTSYVLCEIDRNYAHMLNCGATSFWETLKGAEDFGGAGSLCHGWSAIPIIYYRKLC